jgi:hypothetical protein
MAAQARQQRWKISRFPKDHEVKRAVSKLSQFDPHDVDSLRNEAKANETIDFDAAFFLAFRGRTDTQLNELLLRLGVDPSRPDAWKRGFFWLAFWHHRIDHLAWRRRLSNKNSASWTAEQDLALLREVSALGQQGLSERAAVERLASDPKKLQLFGYRKKGYFPKAQERQKLAAALRARLRKLKASSRQKSILDLLLGVSPGALSSIERWLYEFEVTGQLPKIGENPEHLQKPVRNSPATRATSPPFAQPGDGVEGAGAT